MTDMIHVRPVPDRRRAFAQWATTQVPKVRTVSPVDFAVPGRLFTEVPEELLIGSQVDGHRYVSPLEEEQAPPVLPEGDGLDAVPVDGGGNDSGSPDEDALASYECSDCGRPYATERGLSKHRRREHTGG